MDLSVREDASRRAVTPVREEAQTGAFFTSGREEAAPDYPVGDRPLNRKIPVPPPSRSKKRVASGAAGLCAFGLAIYGWEVRHDSPNGAGLTVRVPAASQSVAALKALPPPNLLKPVSPEEATKENAERPFVARPDIPAARFVLHADADNRARALTCLAQAVYYEAAGEGVDGGRAVAQVVLNRVRHPGFPSTICGVVYEGSDRSTGCQFSFTCDGSMQRVPVPWLWTRSKQIAEQALRGSVFAPVGHATHYHADYVLPYWADSLDKSVQVGRHIFYRLRNSLGEARAFSQHYSGAEPPFHEPGATIVIPPTAEGQQLANALIGDGPQAPTKQADPAAHKPDIPLVIDSTASTLLADGQSVPGQQVHRRKATSECSTAADGKQLAPLGAVDMRSDVSASTC
jgi:spore germination cell wall hydrolase CwlJ-like protein